MSREREQKQEREWAVLHDRILAVLAPHGRIDAVGKGDYWLLDENWGLAAHQLELQDLRLLHPDIIKSLQGLLAGYPDWRITVAVAVPGTEHSWPGIGLGIYDDQIVDELQREFLPEEFRDIRYE